MEANLVGVNKYKPIRLSANDEYCDAQEIKNDKNKIN
jgi:hypothetical protein